MKLSFRFSSCSSEEKFASCPMNSSLLAGSSGSWFWSCATSSSMKAVLSSACMGRPAAAPRAEGWLAVMPVKSMVLPGSGVGVDPSRAGREALEELGEQRLASGRRAGVGGARVAFEAGAVALRAAAGETELELEALHGEALLGQRGLELGQVALEQLERLLGLGAHQRGDLALRERELHVQAA